MAATALESNHNVLIGGAAAYGSVGGRIEHPRREFLSGAVESRLAFGRLGRGQGTGKTERRQTPVRLCGQHTGPFLGG